MKKRLTAVLAALALATPASLGAATQAQELPAPAPAAPAETAEPTAQVDVPASVEDRVLAATERNLSGMGHDIDPVAADIAAQWADEAAAGGVEFLAGAGKGTSHRDLGDGTIYALTPAEAEGRIQWLDQPVSQATDARGFGVASASDGGTIYVAEFFLY